MLLESQNCSMCGSLLTSKSRCPQCSRAPWAIHWIIGAICLFALIAALVMGEW